MDQADENSRPDQRPASVLHRKTHAGHVARHSKSVSLAKALRLSLAKVADQQMGLPLAVIAARVEVATNENLADVFDDAKLLMLMDGASGRRGAVVFDADLVGAVIQQQTMGRVTAPLPGDPRPMTDTDAAICTPLLDGFLTQAAIMPDDPQDRALLDGFRFGARVPNTRLLLMSLVQPEYKIIHLTVDLAGGARQGRIMLCLPDIADVDLVSDGDPKAAGGKPAPALLDRTVLALNVELNVALTTLQMPLGVMQNFAVGTVFDLGITAFDEAFVQTLAGRRLGGGVLGQIKGMRALQLEHSKVPTRAPRRRVTDRAGLDLPTVAGDGTGTRAEDRRAADDAMDMDASFSDIDATNMPALGGQAGLATEALTETSDIDDLPDMSDLPGFEAEEEEERSFG